MHNSPPNFWESFSWENVSAAVCTSKVNLVVILTRRTGLSKCHHSVILNWLPSPVHNLLALHAPLEPRGSGHSIQGMMVTLLHSSNASPKFLAELDEKFLVNDFDLGHCIFQKVGTGLYFCHRRTKTMKILLLQLMTWEAVRRNWLSCTTLYRRGIPLISFFPPSYPGVKRDGVMANSDYYYDNSICRIVCLF